MASADFFIAQGNRLPSFERVLIGRDRQVIDLTGASVQFQMRGPDGCGARAVSAPAVIVDARAGFVRYDWADNDTATPGFYVASWKITFASGLVEDVPDDDYDRVRIRPKLG